MNLEGKAVLVTGGGTGLGRALVLAAARAGAHVAVNYSRSVAEAESTAAEAERLGVRAAALRASVDDPSQAEGLISAAERALGPLVALVNNAGVTRGVPFEDLESRTQRIGTGARRESRRRVALFARGRATDAVAWGRYNP